MKEIKKRLIILIIFSFGLLTFTIVLFAYADTVPEERIYIESVILTILLTVVLFGFFIVEYRKCKFARLIIDNKIMYIEAAQIDKGDEGIDVYISCFGILLNSRVIKFNIDGIKLKGVQIDHESIYLHFGTDKTTRKIRILHGNIGQLELNGIVERFYYETGVVPKVLNFERKQCN